MPLDRRGGAPPRVILGGSKVKDGIAVISLGECRTSMPAHLQTERGRVRLRDVHYVVFGWLKFNGVVEDFILQFLGQFCDVFLQSEPALLGQLIVLSAGLIRL